MKKISLFVLSFLLFSCGNKPSKMPPVDLTDLKNENIVEIPYEEIGGVKTIPVKINGTTLDMIYDTGCSGISLSLTELQLLSKQGKIQSSDVLGTTYATIADGSIVENGRVLLREVEIGGKNGVRVENVEAHVHWNEDAPVLLGNTVLDAVASIEVDNIQEVIRFKKK